MLVLLAVAAGMWIQQSRFNPAVKVAVGAAAAEKGTPPAPSPAPTKDVIAQWSEGLRPLGAPESFSPDTLSDKIDGKAELYFSAGFVRLRCQRVALSGSPGTWIEIFAFDMGQPDNAFSVYSSQRRKEVVEVNVGDHAYRAGNALCLVHGKNYVELVGADAQKTTVDALQALARRFVEETPVEGHADVSREESLFPREGLLPGRGELLTADAFGFDQLDHVFVAHYRDGKDEVTLFLARRATPAEATRLAAAYRQFLVKDCEGREVEGETGVPNSALIHLDGMFEALFYSGSMLGGVHQAPSRDVALRWLGRLSQNVRKAGAP